jgi:hypothetical protein
MTHQEYTQWNADVHSSIGRNVGAMMAGYGKNWIEKNAKGDIVFKTSVNIENVVQFEELYKKLKSPSWKKLAEKNIVPHLSQEGIERGSKIYNQACLQCHAVQPKSTSPNSFGNTYWESIVIPASIVGTIDDHLLADHTRRAKVSPFVVEKYRQAFGPDIVDKNGTVPANVSRGFLVGAVLNSYFSENNIPVQKILQMSNCRDNLPRQAVVGFKSKSLEGIIWTAPYLHNGSVPTLTDLLKPAQDRPKKFSIGCQNYDVAKLGFDCNEPDPENFLFDTNLEGNSNQGHEYGTELSEEQKEYLITYLKSLEQPEAPSPMNPTCN